MVGLSYLKTCEGMASCSVFTDLDVMARHGFLAFCILSFIDAYLKGLSGCSRVSLTVILHGLGYLDLAAFCPAVYKFHLFVQVSSADAYASSASGYGVFISFTYRASSTHLVYIVGLSYLKTCEGPASCSVFIDLDVMACHGFLAFRILSFVYAYREFMTSCFCICLSVIQHSFRHTNATIRCISITYIITVIFYCIIIYWFFFDTISNFNSISIIFRQVCKFPAPVIRCHRLSLFDISICQQVNGDAIWSFLFFIIVIIPGFFTFYIYCRLCIAYCNLTAITTVEYTIFHSELSIV